MWARKELVHGEPPEIVHTGQLATYKGKLVLRTVTWKGHICILFSYVSYVVA